MTDLSKFQLLVKQNELSSEIASQLHQVLSNCDIVLLCDDSGSMQNAIIEGNTNKQTTRWLELKKLASVIIEFVTAINPNGLDIYFFHRPTLRNVVDMTNLQNTFNELPNGRTPLISTLKKIYKDKSDLPAERQLLIVVITDGEPTDGSYDDLYYALVNKRDNVHVSLAECTDNEEEMRYLDSFDGRIRNFDNTDDYREELARVKAVQGQQFKFDYTDYVIKILLATFVRWYFNLDQTGARQVNNYVDQSTYKRQDSGCCSIL